MGKLINIYLSFCVRLCYNSIAVDAQEYWLYREETLYGAE